MFVQPRTIDGTNGLETIGQAQIFPTATSTAAVDPAAAAKFAAEAKKLGGAVNPRNVLPLVPYVEPGGLLPRSFPADQLARFKKAGFALEAAQKQALKAQKGGGLSGMAVRGAPAS